MDLCISNNINANKINAENVDIVEDKLIIPLEAYHQALHAFSKYIINQPLECFW